MSHTQRQCSYLMPWLLLFVAICRIPVHHGLMRPLFQLLVESAVIVSVGAYIYQNINKFLGVGLLLIVISSIYPHFDQFSYIERNELFYLSIWFLILCMNKIKVANLLDVICVISLFNVIFAILQLYKLVPYDETMIVGLMANCNELSSLLAICTPAFFRKKWIFCYPIIIIGFILAKSTGGIIAVFGGILFYSYIKYKGLCLKHVSFISLFYWLFRVYGHILNILTNLQGLLIKRDLPHGKTLFRFINSIG